MPTIGSMTRTVRFNPEDLGKIESMMKKEDTSFNNAVHLLINDTGTPQKKEVCTPNKDYESISEMANLMRVSTEKLFADFRDLLENGDLYYTNGKLRNPRYEELEDLAERKGANLDKILSKVVRELENGK